PVPRTPCPRGCAPKNSASPLHHSDISSSHPIHTHRPTGDSKITFLLHHLFSSQLPLVGRHELLESGREVIPSQCVGLLLILDDKG
ncbi:hypothetical protein PFISCL1PPCAC_24686, partial [Pristionchus fissidentatus]